MLQPRSHLFIKSTHHVRKKTIGLINLKLPMDASGLCPHSRASVILISQVSQLKKNVCHTREHVKNYFPAKEVPRGQGPSGSQGVSKMGKMSRNEQNEQKCLKMSKKGQKKEKRARRSKMVRNHQDAVKNSNKKRLRRF